MSEKIAEITLSPAKLFNMYLKGHGITYTWVAQNLDVSPTYVYCLCAEKLPLSEKMRQKMNELLDTNY